MDGQWQISRLWERGLMIRAFRDFPIKRKLSFVIVLTCTLVLSLASAAFFGLEYLSSRNELLNTVRTLGAIVADNSTAALAFQNRTDAERTLKFLQADPRIVYAALFDSAGNFFVGYGNPAHQPTALPEPGFRFTNGELIYIQLVETNDDVLGKLLIRASMAQSRARLRSYLLVTGLILGLSFFAAWICARILRRGIAQPILDLAEITRAVSGSNNYAIRANKHGNDELGELSDSFNRMMERIQAAHTELRASGERLGLALEAGRIGTWAWNLRTNRVYWDEYVPPLLGIGREGLAPFWEALVARVHPDDRERVKLSQEAREAEGSDLSLSFRVVCGDGSLRYLACRGRVARESDGSRSLLGVLIDATTARRAEEEVRRLNEELEARVAQRTEELAQANRDLEAFTYSVSHDLRAPLRHVNGFAQMLEEQFHSVMPADARRLLSRIQAGAKHMGNLVDDLLRLARVGRQELTFQKCLIRPLVEQVIAEIRLETEGRVIEWSLQDLPDVEGDPGLIRQVFTNLIANAVKYSRDRAVARIEIGSTIDPPLRVFWVKDNGVGFDMRYVDKLFGVFQRLHRVEEFEGTGVGLAIVQRIVQKHGGRVWAEGTVGQGACFYFSLPLQRLEIV
jgi:signal transduction histidine kinase/HAMP domain-containing protein